MPAFIPMNPYNDFFQSLYKAIPLSPDEREHMDKTRF